MFTGLRSKAEFTQRLTTLSPLAVYCWAKVALAHGVVMTNPIYMYWSTGCRLKWVRWWLVLQGRMAKGYSSIYDAQYTRFNTRYRSVNDNTFKPSCTTMYNQVRSRNAQTDDNRILIGEPERTSTCMAGFLFAVRLLQHPKPPVASTPRGDSPRNLQVTTRHGKASLWMLGTRAPLIEVQSSHEGLEGLWATCVTVCRMVHCRRTVTSKSRSVLSS